MFNKTCTITSVQFSSVAQLCPTLQPREPQHARPHCPSPTPGVYPNSCPLSWWCHLTISSSVVPFSSCIQSFSTSGSFQMSQLFTSGGQSIGVSASTSVLPMYTQDWFPLGWTGWISLQSKGLSRVFSNITVQKHQLFCTQLSLPDRKYKIIVNWIFVILVQCCVHSKGSKSLHILMWGQKSRIFLIRASKLKRESNLGY